MIPLGGIPGRLCLERERLLRSRCSEQVKFSVDLCVRHMKLAACRALDQTPVEQDSRIFMDTLHVTFKRAGECAQAAVARSVPSASASVR